MKKKKKKKVLTLKELDKILKIDRETILVRFFVFLIIILNIIFSIFYFSDDVPKLIIYIISSTIAVILTTAFITSTDIDAIEGCAYYLYKELKKYNLYYSYIKKISYYLEGKIKYYLLKDFIIDKSYNLIKGDHFVVGYLLIAREYIDEETKKIKKTDFKDVVILIGDLDKKFNGLYVLVLDEDISDLERIKLDLPEFEDLFDVYGTDQIEGRYIFDFTFMENLIRVYIKKRFKKIVFSNGKFYIYFETGDLNLDKKFSFIKYFFNFPDAKTCVKEYIETVLSYASIYDMFIKNKHRLMRKNININIQNYTFF